MSDPEVGRGCQVKIRTWVLPSNGNTTGHHCPCMLCVPVSRRVINSWIGNRRSTIWRHPCRRAGLECPPAIFSPPIHFPPPFQQPQYLPPGAHRPSRLSVVHFLSLVCNAHRKLGATGLIAETGVYTHGWKWWGSVFLTTELGRGGNIFPWLSLLCECCRRVDRMRAYLRACKDTRTP